MNKILTCIFAIFFIGCVNRDHKDADLLIEINKGFDNSNRMISDANKEVYQKFQEHLNDPVFHERSLIWSDKIDTVRMLSKNLLDYTTLLKTNVEKKAGLNTSSTGFKKMYDEQAVETVLNKTNQGSELAKRLIFYKDHLLAMNEGLRNAIGHEVPEILGFTTLQNVNDNYENLFFKGRSVIEALAILNTIRNNIMVVENKAVTFFYYKTCMIIESFDKFGVIISQSSNIIKPADELVIAAGVGAFSIQTRPNFTINGKKIEIDNGFASYKLKGQTKPGKYFVPVKVEYTNQNGIKCFMEKKIDYTVFDTTRKQ